MKMLTKGNVYAGAAIAGMLCLAAAAAAYALGNSSSAQDFVTKASIANEFEIESSKLALDKSQDGPIKSFAQAMVTDHTKTADAMTSALRASRSGAQAATKLDDKHQKLMDKLEAAGGGNFNKQYVSIQTDAHKEAVSLFSSYANNGKDKPLRDFAADTLPTLKDHLKHVQDLKNKQ